MMTALNLRNFDADETVPRPRPAPVRTYSEDEVQRMVRAAHERGVAEGHAAGLEEGRAGAEASHDGLATEAMAAMTTALEELSGEAQAHRAALEAQVIEFAHSVCDTVFPELVEGLSRSRVAAQVRQGMKMAIGSSAITVRLAPETLNAVTPDLCQNARYWRIDGALSFEPDESLAPGEVRMTWDHGALDYAYEVVTARILSELRRTRDAATEAAR